MKKEEKHLHYATVITAKILELFSEDSDLQIDLDELSDDDNLTHFFHALSNLVPSHFYNKITGDSKNILQFNHVANQLVFQYSIKES